ncbi:uncharacterized protein RB166_014730 [Leptodactylus fuscus]
MTWCGVSGAGNLSGSACTYARIYCRPCLIWILGHSYVFWGALRAEVRPDGRQLGLRREEAVVQWLGVRGMPWSRVLPEFHFYCRVDSPPHVLVLHVGGNDLGARPSRELIKDIKFDVLRLLTEFPGLIVVWSDIVARLVWRHARSAVRIEKTRIKVNREVARFVLRNGGLVVRHRELEVPSVEHLRRDGVHLNAIGTDIWMLGLRGGVERALEVWRDSRP